MKRAYLGPLAILACLSTVTVAHADDSKILTRDVLSNAGAKACLTQLRQKPNNAA